MRSRALLIRNSGWRWWEAFEGKTSIAAAWIERLDKSMKIDHQESNDAVKIYDIDNEIELVDTPGLFGFKEK
ncbi:hypothetical protein HpHA286_07810 [Helicobacter pylori]